MSFFSPQIANQQKKPKKLLNISDDQINSAQQATPVKYLAGRGYLAGDYISPAYNQVSLPKKTTTGKGDSQITGYVYFADFAQIFCMGGRVPVRGLRTIIVDSEIVWSGTVDRGVAEYADVTVENHGTMRIYWGSDTQPIDPLVLTERGVVPVDPDFNPRDSSTFPANAATGGQITHNGRASGDDNPTAGHYDRHPAYRGQCYAVFKKWKLGRDRTQVPNIQVELIRDVPFVGSTTLSSDDTGVPIAGVLFDWLTDDRFGAGLPESSLLTSSFTALATALATYRISPIISSQEQFRSVIGKLLEYFDGWLRRNGRQLECGFWSHGNVDTSGLPVLADDDFDSEPDLTPTGFGDTVNEVTVMYRDRTHHFNDYPQVYRDPNNRRIVGEPRPVYLQREWITDAALAKKYATEYGTLHAQPSTTGSLEVKRESLMSSGLKPGDRFVLDTNTYGLAIVCRINEIEWPEDKATKAKMSIEAERGLWPSLYIAPPSDSPGDFFTGAQPILNHRVIELPQGLKTPGVTTNQVAVLADRSSTDVIGFRSWLSADGTTYSIAAERNSFAVFGQLGSNYSAATSNPDDTTGAQIFLFGADLSTIVSQSDAARDDNTLLLIIDSEIMSVGTVTALGDGLFKFFVKRGLYGTTIAAHTSGAACWLIFRNQIVPISNRNFVNGATLYFKLQPITAQEDYDLASVTAFTYAFVALDVVPTPAISPGTQSFTGTLNASIMADAGLIVRYAFGTIPTVDSPEWPKSGGSYTTLAVSSSGTLYAVAFTADGRASQPAVVTYTLVSSGSTGSTTCGSVTWTKTGTLGHSTLQVTPHCATPSSTIHYIKTGGSLTTYTSGTISLPVGSSIDFYASAAGMLDSPHSGFDNIDPNL
jgi:hypothetical protein